jgi:hypothetical protein
MARSLKKFRERIAPWSSQKRRHRRRHRAELRAGLRGLEKRLTETRPDLLPRAADYDQVLRRARLGDAAVAAALPHRHG